MIGDSRCCCLLGCFRSNDIRCFAYRGAGILGLCGKARMLVRRYNPVSCLLLGGVNDMTLMNKRTRVIKPYLLDPFDLANYVISLFLQVRQELTVLFPGTKFVFGGIIGVFLNTYNKLPGTSPYQYIIDDAITQINSYLRLLNQLVLASQPRLTSKVHCWRKGTRKNYYHLLRDGLHLGPLIRDTWFSEITKFHTRNSALAPLCSADLNCATVREPS